MDLETENRIAVILMKEAAELRRQAEQEGVHAYLQQRKVRGRPNSRFLTATVLGVQQANRAAEISEMWRVRQKERNLDDKLKRNSREESSSHRQHASTSGSSTSSRHRHDSKSNDASSTSRKREVDCYSHEEDGLRDEEMEEFLHSRMKRGRGEIGSRMDETGPYLLPPSDSTETLSDIRVREDWEDRIVGPEKPASLKLQKPSEDEFKGDDWKKVKKAETMSLKKAESKKQKRKEDKKRHKKKKEKRQRHHRSKIR